MLSLVQKKKKKKNTPGSITKDQPCSPGALSTLMLLKWLRQGEGKVGEGKEGNWV